jgi:hypothetical protein
MRQAEPAAANTPETKAPAKPAQPTAVNAKPVPPAPVQHNPPPPKRRSTTFHFTNPLGWLR